MTSNSSYFVHPNGLCESDDIGSGTRIWAFAHVMTGARVGAGCNIGDHAFVETGVVIGDNVTVKNGVSLWRGLTVEADVFLGPHCTFTNDRRPRATIKRPIEDLLATVVRRGATIGANATVLCGLEVGPGAFVAAGAVVLCDVPAHAVMAGNPASRTGWVCACGAALDDDLRCECGLRYELVGEEEGLRVVE